MSGSSGGGGHGIETLSRLILKPIPRAGDDVPSAPKHALQNSFVQANNTVHPYYTQRTSSIPRPTSPTSRHGGGGRLKMDSAGRQHRSRLRFCCSCRRPLSTTRHYQGQHQSHATASSVSRGSVCPALAQPGAACRRAVPGACQGHSPLQGARRPRYQAGPPQGTYK